MSVTCTLMVENVSFNEKVKRYRMIKYKWDVWHRICRIRRKPTNALSDINKRSMIIRHCLLWIFLSGTHVIASAQEINQTKPVPTYIESDIHGESNESFTMLSYEFFSYDVVDHRTLLIKFDLTDTILFQQARIPYDAYLFISKIPAINSKVSIGRFVGSFEVELDGTITDHFTFCLVLVPGRNQTRLNITSPSNVTSSIYDEFLTSLKKPRQQHLVHYCTKLGPDEDRHRHRLKQGSEGDHVLLVLQLLMIVLFLTLFQFVHTFRARKSKEWRQRQADKIRHEFRFRKKNLPLTTEVLEFLRFASIRVDGSLEKPDEQELDDDDREDFPMLTHRRFSSASTSNRHSRSPSSSIDSVNVNSDASAVEHILSSKPWPRLSLPSDV